MTGPDFDAPTKPNHASNQSMLSERAEALRALVHDVMQQTRMLTVEEQCAVDELVDELRVLVEVTDDVELQG